MAKYSPNTRDAFIDYLSNLEGLKNVEYPKTIALPYMKRQEKPKINHQRSDNPKGHVDLPSSQAVHNRTNPPKKIFQGRSEQPVPDNQPPRPPMRNQQILSHQ